MIIMIGQGRKDREQNNIICNVLYFTAIKNGEALNCKYMY